MWWLGTALLLLLAVDVFFTVFHPHAHGGPINRWQNRIVWWVLCSVASRGPERWQDRLLSLGGPLLALLTLGGWGVTLLTGFAFVYRDFVHLLKHSEVPMDSPWASAFYYSGYVGSTLGLGDVVAIEDWLRIVTIVQGLSGFVLVSVAVSYTLALYRAEGEASSCAIDIAVLFGEGDDELPVPDLDLDRFDRWAEGQGRRFSGVLTSYSRFPILHFFRPPDRRQSLVVQLGPPLRVLETLERVHGADLARYPSIVAFRRAVDFYLEGVYRDFAPGDPIEREEGSRRAAEAQRHERHARLLRHLCYRDHRAGHPRAPEDS